MTFSIYDYKNKLLPGKDGANKSDAIYVGSTKTEADRQEFIPGGITTREAEGGEVSVPFVVEFRVSEQTAGKALTLSVLGAPAKGFNTNGSPVEPAAADYSVVGSLTIAETEAATPYVVAVSSNKHKWFQAKVENGVASAFLMRR